VTDKNLMIDELKIHLYTAKHLKKLSIYNINFEIWQQKTYNTLQMLFGYKSDRGKQFINISFSPSIVRKGISPPDVIQAYQSGLNEAIALLGESINILTDEQFDIGIDSSRIISNVECYIRKAFMHEFKKEEILDRLEKIKATWNEEDSNKFFIDKQNNMLVTLLNRIVSDNEDDRF